MNLEGTEKRCFSEDQTPKTQKEVFPHSPHTGGRPASKQRRRQSVTGTRQRKGKTHSEKTACRDGDVCHLLVLPVVYVHPTSSNSLKAAYRRALANEKLRDFDAALEDVKRGLATSPADTDLLKVPVCLFVSRSFALFPLCVAPLFVFLSFSSFSVALLRPRSPYGFQEVVRSLLRC
ncbi:tetratricopeptide repeat-containing protein [Toxoplasma gondii MAS]|uniref:Tetratricopeptide repeat-containing protein n=1 Tax=Toxoplasma gondii MAS TaxID=943118 RepID=A0A086QNS5_TOXGO|nr:tetratricopeptide repeat-containing protein [Toxoplasma gondii MAS]